MRKTPYNVGSVAIAGFGGYVIRFFLLHQRWLAVDLL